MLTNEEIGSVCMALSQLVHSGINAADALVLLQADEQQPQFKQVLKAMAEGADNGQTLSVVFRNAGCFPQYVCTLLHVGEQVGKLEATLDALAAYYRNRARLEVQLRSALLYPAVLLAVLLAIMTFLLVWVLPVFEQVYSQIGSGLTGIAAGLLALGKGIKQLLPVLLTVIAILIAALLIPKLRLFLISLWKKHRKDRGISGKISRARFMQALSLGLCSGMPAMEAAALAASLAETPAFRSCCDRCCALLEQGISLPQALKDSTLLSSTHCRLLEAGERSGRREIVMESISQNLLEESEDALTQAAGKAEPAVVVIACLLIGLVLLSVMLPLVNIMSTIG